MKRNFGFLTETERDFIMGKKEVSPEYRKVLNYRLRGVVEKILNVRWIDFLDDVRLITQWIDSKPHLIGLKERESFKLLERWGKWGTPKTNRFIEENIKDKNGLPTRVTYNIKAVTIPSIECPYCHRYFDKTFREKYLTTTFYPKVELDDKQ